MKEKHRLIIKYFLIAVAVVAFFYLLSFGFRRIYTINAPVPTTAAVTPTPAPFPVRTYAPPTERAAAATPTPVPTPTPSPTPTPEPTPTPKPTVQPYFADLVSSQGNDDIVGYLKIEGTSVDYLVVQSKDNEFYLNHDINKRRNDAGWIFLDYENDVMLRDYNSVIYGHNMKTDTMFHSIRYYRSYDFYERHKIITFNTLYEDNEWEVFSFYKTDTSFYYIQVRFRNKNDFFNLASQMKQKSMYDTGVEITPEDRILTLSTCTNESENTRFVLHARLIRPETDGG